jgi:hypothetical protein
MIPRDTERPNVIGLQVAGKYEEGRAVVDSTIYPGMALEVTIDEQNPQQLPVGVKPNSVAGATGPLRVADVCLLGNPDPTKIQGMKISDAFLGDTDAAAVARGSGETVGVFSKGALVPYFIPAPGDVFQARVATTANFAIGDMLGLHTDGTFVAATDTAAGAVAMVAEDHDFTADDPAITPLLRVQAL